MLNLLPIQLVTEMQEIGGWIGSSCLDDTVEDDFPWALSFGRIVGLLPWRIGATLIEMSRPSFPFLRYEELHD